MQICINPFLEQPQFYRYDIDNSGEIDKSEMFYVLKVLNG